MRHLHFDDDARAENDGNIDQTISRNNMKQNETFATLLSDASYLPGVIALHRSLRLHSNKPFVCVCSQGIDNDVLGRLHNEGIEHIRLDKASVTPPARLTKTDTAIGTRHSTNSCFGA